MKKIGLLSDTHGSLPDRLFAFFDQVDEIWHAGDIGNWATAEKLANLKPFRAVCGNIDGQDLRITYPLHQRFKCEECDVWITHIGGYPGQYHSSVRKELMAHPPNLFITGHSHILKVIWDPTLNLLHINPGAAGQYGFHKVRSAVRFLIEGSVIRDLEIWQTDKTDKSAQTLF